MATQLSSDDHLAALRTGGAALRQAAEQAGPDTVVPTCPGWDVHALVAHQGMVHRWAADHLRGRPDRSDRYEAEGLAATDPLRWYDAGLAALIDTLTATPADAEAMVFLNDAPAPRAFWARRQAHETTVHGVDARAAELGRPPTADDVAIAPELAADGIDELLGGFITRRRSRLRSPEPYRIAVISTDTGHRWSVSVSSEPALTTAGETVSDADASVAGTAVELYLGLWNRAALPRGTGREDLLEPWRSQVQVAWS